MFPTSPHYSLANRYVSTTSMMLRCSCSPGPAASFRQQHLSIYKSAVYRRRHHQYYRYQSSSSSSSSRIAATKKWFESIVIGEKLCPFAPPLLAKPHLLRIVTSDADSTEQAIEDVATQVQELVGTTAVPSPPPPPELHETTLVVFDNNNDFTRDFRDFVRLSWELQEHAVGDDYESDLQLVLFHPQATHQTYGATENDDNNNMNAADYTIRSPYPTVHLLREVDVMRAVRGGYPNLEMLPSRNKEKMIQQGAEVCQKRLSKCYVEE